MMLTKNCRRMRIVMICMMVPIDYDVGGGATASEAASNDDDKVDYNHVAHDVDDDYKDIMMMMMMMMCRLMMVATGMLLYLMIMIMMSVLIMMMIIISIMMMMMMMMMQHFASQQNWNKPQKNQPLQHPVRALQAATGSHHPGAVTAQVLEETLVDLVQEPEAVAGVVIPEMQRRFEAVTGALQVAGWTHEELLTSLAGVF
ncbi:hypothetical protein DPMN_189066 [Dreissena polymorpha]|uniref:Uncharacterized protein n=1 Tax=Dreissena polymorpha TaxID=45954 RepID=A0A9D4DSU2_DREPO|nr:hypothetical protein DPMN_189066 [Dreissena polymorpha]